MNSLLWRVCVGDTAARGLLQPGDELLTVNDVSLSDLTHFDAWNLLKRLPYGPVRLVVHRPSDPSTNL